MTLPTWRGLCALLTVTGALHLTVPRVFDRIVPRALGAPRPWTLASGVAELACAAALAGPRTRSLGGWASAALLLAVLPANVTMAVAAHRSSAASPGYRAGTLVRLPLQVPLVVWAVHVGRAGRAGAAA